MAENPPGAPGPARRFCRFAAGSPADGHWPLPPDGLCLSAFLVLSPPGDAEEVLVGRIDPRADWSRIGALDPARAARIAGSGGWMLPSSQLQFYESPRAAADRILKEQLGTETAALTGPEVFSESYARGPAGTEEPHWDLHFLFRGTWPSAVGPIHPAWRELAFVDPSETPRSRFARRHDEILDLVGYRFPPDTG